MTIGEFTAFVLYLERLSWPTMSLGWMISTVQQAAASVERLDEVLSTHLPISATQDDSTSLSDTRLEIKNLNFTYQNPYNNKASFEMLKNISLTIPQGDTVAIVGQVGCGKSTLLNLLARVYDPPQKSIYVGKHDITSLSYKNLRSYITLMPQQSYLFSDTIGHNIAYGNPEASQEAIEVATQTTQVQEDILQFQEGYINCKNKKLLPKSVLGQISEVAITLKRPAEL